MSTQISKSLIALFFLGMFVTGCNTNTKQTADNDIKFDSIRVDRTYHLLNNPDNPNCNLQLNFTYPAKFSDKEDSEKEYRMTLSSPTSARIMRTCLQKRRSPSTRKTI